MLLLLLFALESFKVGIVGPGAVGSYFAMQFSQAENTKVYLIGRPESAHLQKIQTQGLRIKATHKGEEKNITIDAAKFEFIGAASQLIEKLDLIVIALKQYHLTKEIAEQIRNIGHENTIYGIAGNGIPFFFLRNPALKKTNLNSVDPKGEILKIFADSKIIGIFPLIASNICEPGSVLIKRDLDSISVDISDAYNEMREPDHMKRVFDLFNNAGVKTKIIESSDSSKDPLGFLILNKLQFAASINVLSAITGRSLGDVFNDPNTQNIIKFIANAVQIAGDICKIGQLRTYEEIKKMQITGLHKSSMCLDIELKRTTEKNHILAALHELLGDFFCEGIANERIRTYLGPIKILLCYINARERGLRISENDIANFNKECGLILESNDD